MNRKFYTCIMLLLISVGSKAQDIVVPEGYELVDSIVYKALPAVDTTLAGKIIWSVMPSKAEGDAATVQVTQPDAVKSALDRQIASNSERSINGYRVRIFFDNAQTARTASETIVTKFSQAYPGVPVYRTYANPYFKVTVGDFRTRSEAMALLVRLENEYPRALLVREKINYPAADSKDTYITDTVKVLRPVVQIQNQ